jgi:hypothetical protein
MVHSEFMPSDTTIIYKEYCETMGKLKAWLWTVRTYVEQSLLQHNNAGLHTSKRTAEIWHFGFTILDHESQSPTSQTEGTSWRHHYALENGSQVSGYIVVPSPRCTIIMWWTYETTWILMKMCRSQRWLCGEITVQRWTIWAQKQITYPLFVSFKYV